ncbi:LysR family transcriptional regulator [Methylobacterium sp. J-030]|uniref:LysR family transcriptional regulator n=1 Tax=Methylobacterium sp. J-030 TaxID=2836627 RepID=UPI001FBB7FB6|nr:LysR family transcriptional regulator [Methylobacterium sp. J-030]MCJ2067966.1 LysR family transcriptional regulator [Methylobacterium sp. J-030]
MAEHDIAALIERDQIRLLLAISAGGSFSAAAAELGITQSSISQQVKRLETIAGFPLFRRNRRGIKLTSECETIIYYARAMEKLAEDMRLHFKQARSNDRVCIGMGEDFCRTALPAVLHLLAKNFPNVDIQIVSGSYDLIAQAISARSVDLVVMRRWDRYPDTKLLWIERQVWYGQARFAAPIEDPVPLVVPFAPNPTRTTLIDALKAQGRVWKVRFESVGMAGIEAALQCGIGVCGGPRHMPMYGVQAIEPGGNLPKLPDVEFVMVGPSASSSGVVRAVAEVLLSLACTGFRAGTVEDASRLHGD